MTAPLIINEFSYIWEGAPAINLMSLIINSRKCTFAPIHTLHTGGCRKMLDITSFGRIVQMNVKSYTLHNTLNCKTMRGCITEILVSFIVSRK